MKTNERGFTIIEILVVITIIGVLAALLMPALNSVRNTSKETDCRNNVRQITQALLAYVASYNGVFPATYKHEAPAPVAPPFDDFTYDQYAKSWVEALQTAHDNNQLEFSAKVLSCAMRPSVGADFSMSGTAANYDAKDFPYAYHVTVGGAGQDRADGRGMRASMIQKPDQMALIYEGNHNLGVFSEIPGAGNELNWQVNSMTPSPGGYVELKATIGTLVTNIGNKPDVYLPHGGRKSMVIGMADGSVVSMTLEELQNDFDMLDTDSGFGSIWDNIRP